MAITVGVLITVLLGILFVQSFQDELGPGPVGVEVQPDEPFFMQGDIANFTVTITNYQNWSVAEPNYQEFTIRHNNAPIESLAMHINGIEGFLQTRLIMCIGFGTKK